MADQIAKTVNPQILDAVAQTNKIVQPENAKNQGSGVVYQHVAHSMGLAVQDSVDYLRNISMAAAAATSAAMAMLTYIAATDKTNPPDPKYINMILEKSTQSVEDATNQMKNVGETASQVLSKFQGLF